ncbi:MAG: bacteriohemerythrin [Alkalispirochaeta sp.]
MQKIEYLVTAVAYAVLGGVTVQAFLVGNVQIALVIAMLSIVAAIVRAAFLRGNAGIAGDVEVVPDRFADLSRRVGTGALDAEGVGRKLAAQVGETLSSTARIASETVDARSRVQALSDEISEGASAMEEILAAIESVSRQIDEQGHVVDQSAAAIEEMSASIESVASVAAGRRASAENLRTVTESGNRTVKTTAQAITDVGESVVAVNAMIEIINDIAARTNLLAMNAAIEAAHAGASGRGFAVVASEIRKLAETTSQNAGQISERLETLVGRIQDARVASDETRAAFDEIEEGVVAVADAFGEITDSTREISAGTKEVVSATESLRDLSRQIVGSSEEMKIGAREVTGVITAARDTAHDTVEAMAVIAGAAGDVTRASNRISALSIESNEHVIALLDLAEEHAADETRETEARDATWRDARERLKISNIILTHMEWVGTVREIVDAGGIDVAELPRGFTRDVITDPTVCRLGEWLATEGKVIIPDATMYRRIADIHREIHGIAARIVEGGEVEERFGALLDRSRALVEVLTALQGGSFVRWSPDFAVDVERFDSHHKRLFALVDQLYRVMQSGSTTEHLKKVFDELLEYTGYHFGAEESAFEHFGYPQCDTHKEQHAELVREATRLRADLEAGKTMVAVDVMEFLRDWLTRHIKGCDRLYSSFFRDKEVERFLAENLPVRSITN